MRYVSTRGGAPVLGFDDVLLSGLAVDGGLYVPATWPDPVWPVDRTEGYASVATRVLRPFVAGSIVEGELEAILRDVYAGFDHPDVAPLRRVAEHHALMELFWGPTLSFKDYALGVVGALFTRVLDHRNRSALVLGATSGDTGSAAMAALAGRENVDVVILYPHGRISDVQRRQMTTLEAENVHAVAVDGTFDDCQDLVKAMFGSPIRDELGLAAVNSINWARIAVQAAYHVWAAVSVGSDVTVAVPTGNFGNVLSADVARRLGAPIERMVAATNVNGGVTDLIETGRMRIDEVVPTVAPAMDVAVPSNLERHLFELLGRDPEALTSSMDRLRRDRILVIDEVRHATLRSHFRAGSVTDGEALETIRAVHREHGLLIDPHTAIGWTCGRDHRASGTALVTVATAHPAKFADAVEAATGVDPPVPERLVGLSDRPERIERIGADPAALATFLRSVGSR